ncbi:nucleotidyltransferase family protein [Dysgonomonas sp. 25]|uniref:nucleotidyltransferase family protein n=1 Tax=Dysgonomonas sp. 25 TaxID=2302933 RepID=UPI0013CFA1B9|nr:nucleotidyltransferase family protein [Dysgonomonas sp. 25]NDV67852.1 D-mannose-1-phosphate guanyltransferase [Dysgonomonas sp. 25]
MKECIILAGGLGTRLQSVVKDVPKCMAEVAGKPFLHYIFQYLEKQQFDHIILALGYKAEIIIDWYQTLKVPFEISYVIEEEALGTGGAIQYAFTKVKSNKAFVLNGDTFFDVDTTQLQSFHQQKEADISIALKPMNDFDRYGTVILDDACRITAFKEKQFCKEGLINGGIYLIDKALFDKLDMPAKFSFEKDIMESRIADLKLYGCQQNGYFIDIGIPSDFEKANKDFKEWK